MTIIITVVTNYALLLDQNANVYVIRKDVSETELPTISPG